MKESTYIYSAELVGWWRAWPMGCRERGRAQKRSSYAFSAPRSNCWSCSRCWRGNHPRTYPMGLFTCAHCRSQAFVARLHGGSGPSGGGVKDADALFGRISSGKHPRGAAGWMQEVGNLQVVVHNRAALFQGMLGAGRQHRRSKRKMPASSCTNHSPFLRQACFPVISDGKRRLYFGFVCFR